MIRHRKAQGVLYAMALLIIFLIIWIAGLGAKVSELVGTFVGVGELTGFSAFFFTNFTIWITAFLLIAIAAVGAAANG